MDITFTKVEKELFEESSKVNLNAWFEENDVEEYYKEILSTLAVLEKFNTQDIVFYASYADSTPKKIAKFYYDILLEEGDEEKLELYRKLFPENVKDTPIQQTADGSITISLSDNEKELFEEGASINLNYWIDENGEPEEFYDCVISNLSVLEKLKTENIFMFGSLGDCTPDELARHYYGILKEEGDEEKLKLFEEILPAASTRDIGITQTSGGVEYYTSKLYDYLETLDTKIAKKVFNKFDEDILSVYVKDGVFFIEPTNSNFPIPNYVSNWIHKEMVKRGFEPCHKGIITSKGEKLITSDFNAIIDSGDWHLSSKHPSFLKNKNVTSGRVFFGDKEFEIWADPAEIKLIEYGPTEYCEKIDKKYVFMCTNLDDLEGLYHIKQDEHIYHSLSVISNENDLKRAVTTALLNNGAISVDMLKQYKALKDSSLGYPAQYYKKMDFIQKYAWMPSVWGFTESPGEKFSPELIEELKHRYYKFAVDHLDKDLPLEYNVKLLALRLVSNRFSDQRIKMVTDFGVLFAKLGCTRKEFADALGKALKDPVVIACKNNSWNRIEDAVKKSKAR